MEELALIRFLFLARKQIIAFLYLSLFPDRVCIFFQLIAECEQVKTEREIELINEQVLIAMSEMGLDRERTLQVGQQIYVAALQPFVQRRQRNVCLFFFFLSSLYKRMHTITTVPFTVCWLNASRNTRTCVLHRPHRASAIL